MKNRFRTIEMGIFSVVSLIFLNSVYHLFTDGKLLTSAPRTPIATQTADAFAAPKTGEAGATQAAYETRCQAAGESFATEHGKIRIVGPFCGMPTREIAGEKGATRAPIDKNILTQFRIENVTNNYTATVFNDMQAGSFSTDFIPVEKGQNKIRMEFHYRGGKVFPVEVVVTRN